MKKLLSGLRKYMSTEHAKEEALFQRLATGQAPEVFWVTCSDSRVVPHLIAQAGPGDMFVLRNAGNFVPRQDAPAGGEAATVDYAAELLEVSDVVVCGHSDCGAMKALLGPDLRDKLPRVAAWLEHASAVRGILAKREIADEEARLRAAIELNVLVQLQNLLTYPSVASRVERGDMALHGWVYDIGSGEVRGFDAAQGRFVGLREADPNPLPASEAHESLAKQLS